MKPYFEWRCPECGQTARTPPTPAKSQTMHPCPKLRGLSAPMVREDQSAQIVLHEREDYVGDTDVQLDPELNRPVMSMETKYADGHTDLRVYAPRARVKIARR